MPVFVDTSGIIAVLNRRDENHQPAVSAWSSLVGSNEDLVTTNYVLLETTAVLARHLGLPAVRALHDQIRPAVEVSWVDPALHELGVAVTLAANRRGLSLVDCISFEVMRRQGIETAFAFDARVSEHGFRPL